MLIVVALIVERNVKKMPLMFSSPFLHPELFHWYNSWLTIFFKNVHMLYLLFSKNRLTTFISLLH